MLDLRTNRDGTEVNRSRGERANFRRSRKYAYGPGKVETDGAGNITIRPLTRGLPCFGDVVEYVRGVGDTPYYFHGANGTEEVPWWCGGCKVAVACGKVAWERIQSATALEQAHNAWFDATARLPDRTDRYEHPTYAVFVAAAESGTWTDSNDAQVKADNAKRAAAAKAKRKGRLQANKRLRNVTDEIRAAIEEERKRRTAILLDLHPEPRAPKYIVKLTPEGCKRTADVWAIDELLRRQGVKNGFNRKIAMMIGEQRPATVGTDLRRISRLETEPEGNPVWPEFTP